VFPDYPNPHLIGLIGTGALTDADVADTGGILRMTFGDNAFLGYVKIEGRPVYWFNSYSAEEHDIEKVTDPQAYARIIRSLDENDPYPHATILSGVVALNRNYPIYDMPTLPQWSRGHAILIGDAAHAVGPHAGQGASMAIEDALVLAACLGAKADVVAAFRRFEGLRCGRIKRIVKSTARNGSHKRTVSAIDLLVRDLVLPFLIPLGFRVSRQLYEFRVDRAPLMQP